MIDERAGDPIARPEPRARAAAIVFVIALLIFVATTGYAYTSMDVVAGDFGSWLLVHTGTQNIDGRSLPSLDASPIRYVWVQELQDGTEVIARAAGVVVAGLPAYLLAGSGAFSIAPGAITAAAISAMSVVMVFLTLAHHLKRREALLAAVVFGFTTPVWSVAANGLWPHTLTVFGICGMAWAATRDKWIVVGCFSVVCLWGRPQTAVLILVLGLLIGLMRRDWRPVAQIGAVSTVGLASLSWWNHVTFDSFSPLAPYDPNAALVLVEGLGRLANQLGMWVAPDRGILIWTPILLVLLPAVVTSWRGLPDWSRALAYAGVAYTLVHASLVEFTGGEGIYGYRYTLELLACLTPAFAMSAPAMGRVEGRLFAPVLGLQACVIAAGSIKDVLVVASDRAWRDHSFLAIVSDTPVTSIALLTAAVLAAWLGQRIWRDPGLTRS
ncbi:MAG: hypothetical protein ABIR39_13080 [Nocardioides sp.]|uniref:hypothetical protein n=1 Tax=Nocardioides sp. TaxID=35761 RepID=UPI003266300F